MMRRMAKNQQINKNNVSDTITLDGAMHGSP